MLLQKKIAIFCIFITFSVFFITSCSITIPLNNNYWDNRDNKIAIAMIEPTNLGLFLTGKQGLLDYIINNAANLKLTNHIKTININKTEESIKNILFDEFKSKGFNIVKLDKYIKIKKFKKTNLDKTFSKYDLSSLSSKYNINQILLVDIKYGISRKYYGFIPTGKPKVDIQSITKIIDLSNNKLLFLDSYLSNDQKIKKWKQPPNYPNITSALTNGLNSLEKYYLNLFK